MPPEGEFYYEVCASAGKLYYICNDMLWGTSGGIYVSDMDGGGMRQLLGPEDIVYTDIFDTCSDGEGGLWLLLMGGVPREFDEGLLFDSFVTRIMDAGPEHGLCIELGSYVRTSTRRRANSGRCSARMNSRACSTSGITMP